MEKEISKQLKNILKNVSASPGIYKMKDQEGNVLYVGKAKHLKKRLSSYFQKGHAHSSRTVKMLEHTVDFEWVVTDSELEAYILETNLIKALRPRYNILMKDDKGFVYIKITVNEDFPRLRIVRKVEKDGAKYIGPKTNTSEVYETFRVLKKVLPFRHCQLDITWKEDSKDVDVMNRVIDFPCLDYFIKRCPGPCIGGISPEEYRKTIVEIIHFLEGKGEKVTEKLKQEMAEAARDKKFELAARLRDKLFAVEHMMEKQKINDPDRKDTDIIHFTVEMGKTFFALFRIRDGKLIESQNFIFDALECDRKDLNDPEILEAFVSQYYERAVDMPQEILLPIPLENPALMHDFLSAQFGKSIKILTPERGEKNKLLELCGKNAEAFAKQSRIKWMAKKAQKEALSDLAKALELNLPNGKFPLRRIECFDISHIGGEDTVGSMVVFENGYAKKEHYRHFKLRTVQGTPNDFESMKEVLARRLKYLATKLDAAITIRIATKKDFGFIQKTIEQEPLSKSQLQQKDFLIMKRKKQAIGFARMLKLSDRVSVVSSMWIHPDERGKRLGYFLLKKLIEKSKLKRIYLDTVKNLESYYADFGFVTLKQPPEILIQRVLKMKEKAVSMNQGLMLDLDRDIVYMAYDVKKHSTDLSFASTPDLLMVDGGKPQLTAALESLKKYDMHIPVIGLAKRLEEVYMPGKSAPYLFGEGEEALKLLQRIRDEAHRFAITFQRNLHRKNLLEK